MPAAARAARICSARAATTLATAALWLSSTPAALSWATTFFCASVAAPAEKLPRIVAASSLHSVLYWAIVSPLKRKVGRKGEKESGKIGGNRKMAGHC